MRRSDLFPLAPTRYSEVFYILLISACGCLSDYAVAESDFEEGFLRRDKNGVSPEVFLYHNAITPGLKEVDIRVNDRLAERRNIYFVSNNQKQTTPCLSRSLLQKLGIKVQLYDGWKTNGKEDNAVTPTTLVQCEIIQQRIPAAEVIYDDTQQILAIRVPQEAIDSERYSMISPEEWDHGTPSLRTSYNGYYYSSKMDGVSNNGVTTKEQTSRSAYINLDSVGTFGAWRLYSIDSFYRNPGQGWDSNHDRVYISRDIATLRSNFQAGEIYTKTAGYMTGAIPLSGASLGTNEQISLDNQFSYAPVIRGVARTNARLVVSQRGNIIYSTTLTPGPFAIDDLYSAQVGADLDVSVEESDGQVQKFRVAYTALPNMIRAGAKRYSLAAGKYRKQSYGSYEPWVTTGSFEFGFEHFTLSNTALVSEDYQFISTGVAWNIGSIGAFSTEFAHTRYNDKNNDNHSNNGSAARFLYARFFDATDTSLHIMGYQYRSRDFLDFSEYVSAQNGYRTDDDWSLASWEHHKRTRIEMNITQNLADYGSLFLMASQERFYGTDKKNTSISSGYGTSIGSATVSLYWMQTKDSRTNDNQLNLSISMPLGKRDIDNRDYGSLNYGLTRDRNNKYSQTLGYSGSTLDNTINYSANVQRDTYGEYSESGTIGFNSSQGSISGGVSHSSGYTQYSAGMNGGMTLYNGGLVLSPRLNKTVAIIDTGDASGIGISGTSNTKTDYFGHAMVGSLTPYRYNEINLDTTGTEGVEIRDSSRQVVPSDGAAVLLKFATRTGRRAMVEIHSPKSIPLGAMVYIKGEKEEAGIVGNKGMTYLSGLDARSDQKMNVVWGNNQTKQCSFTLPALKKTQDKPEEWYQKIVVNCQ